MALGQQPLSLLWSSSLPAASTGHGLAYLTQLSTWLLLLSQALDKDHIQAVYMALCKHT